MQQQTISENKTIKTIIMAMGGVLKLTKVQELVQHKGRLVEVPYTATVGDTLNSLLAKNILAVPVAAPPGQWVGAGGSMIMEADKSTGRMRKQYIGMVSVLDILIHVVEEEGGEEDFAGRLSSTVASVIGHSLEGLSLWTVSPNASVYEVMEPMSKGIHRALVPVESLMHQPHHAPVEIMESSTGYHMLTQTDMVRFLLVHAKELEFVTGLSVSTLGLMQTSVFAAPSNMKVMDVVKCMRNVSLAAVAIVENSPDIIPDDPMLVIGRGRKLLGKFSASDLRGCTAEVLQAWSSLSIMDFFGKASVAQQFGVGAAAYHKEGSFDSREMVSPPVTCYLTSSLQEVMSTALENHVHQVWVVDNQGLLLGVVTFSDIMKVVRNFPSKQLF